MAFGVKFKLYVFIILINLFSILISMLYVDNRIFEDLNPIVFYLVLLCIVLAISSVFIFLLTKPVKDITIAADIFASGQYNYMIKSSSNDEFGKIINSINNIGRILKRAQKDKTRYLSRASVEKYKSNLIIDSMADAVIVTDENQDIVLMNYAAETLFDIDLNKLRNRHIIHFLQRYSLENFLSYFPDTKEEIKLPVRERRIVAKEVELEKPVNKIVKVTIAPILDKRKLLSGTLLVFEDITKAKEIEYMKTEIVSTVSHELKTPLTSIKGYTSLLLTEKFGPLDPKVKDCLVVVDRESDRLADLINDILDLSKLQSGTENHEFNVIDIQKCLEESPALDFPKKKGQKLEIHKLENIPMVLGDKTKITQVFTNLISNAVKFTPEDGSIIIKFTKRMNLIQVDITDTGLGIAKKDLTNVFNKFYQVENHLTRKQSGTGLGLPIVKEIIKIHGGIIGISSVPRKGTTLTFVLPTIEEGMINDFKNGGTIEIVKGEPCWKSKDCKKTKCPVFESNDDTCWLMIGAFCKKDSNEQCLNKNEICIYCDIYKNAIRLVPKKEKK